MDWGIPVTSYINKNGGLVYNVEIPCNRENEASQAKKKESNYGFSYLSQGTQYYEEYIFEEDQATDCCVNCTESNIYTAFGCFAGIFRCTCACIIYTLTTSF